jgi:hypothetical protein
MARGLIDVSGLLVFDLVSAKSLSGTGNAVGMEHWHFQHFKKAKRKGIGKSRTPSRSGKTDAEEDGVGPRQRKSMTEGRPAVRERRGTE